MSTNNDSPDPSNFFRRWWRWLAIACTGLCALLVSVVHNYDKVRQNVSLIVADYQAFRQWMGNERGKQTPPRDVVASQPPKEIATAQPPPSGTSQITTQSISPPVAPPTCVSHNPGKILDVLTQAKDAHPRKFEKDFGGRPLCSPGWFATFVEAEKLSNGDTRVTLDSPSGPWLRADVPGGLATPINRGEIVQVFGTVSDYRQKGFFTYGYVNLTKARVVRR